MDRRDIGEAQFRHLAQVSSRVDFFSPFKGAELERILSHIRLYAFEDGEAVFRKGDTPKALYIIHLGAVDISFRKFLWFRKTVRLRPGDLFGEIALLEGRPHSGTALAREKLELFVLLREDFEAILKENQEFSLHVRHLAEARKFETAH